MKKVYLLLAFFFALGLATANAQACQASAAGASKSCCASKVAKAASLDPTIEKRQADNGAVSYVRKETDAQGNVQFVSVQYDEASNAFVNVAPKGALTAGEKSTMTKKTASCSAGAGAEKKACCAGGASKKACAGEKAEKTAMTPEQ
jgi:hypothetical protein